MIDLVLAGDNAIVIGLAAAGLPREQRNKAILVGIVAATVLRIFFASITTWLLAIVGLLLAGGILLLWVCWKMWRELRTSTAESHAAEEALAGLGANGNGDRPAAAKNLCAGCLADRDRRRLHVARQRACRGGCGPRASDRARLRARPLDRADGHRRLLHRPPSAEASLDRLCGPRHHPLRRAQDDVGRLLRDHRGRRVPARSCLGLARRAAAARGRWRGAGRRN